MTSDPWNLRTTPNPLIRAAGRGLARLNDRHPWDHNAHFHPWILRSLLAAATRVLDVGCGRGALLGALHSRIERVDGIDPDPDMAYAAATALRDSPGVRVHRRTFAEQAALPETAEAYDAVTMVGSLHHQSLPDAFMRARRLLRPGGRLLAVTLVRPEGFGEQLWDVSNALTNPVIGVVKHPRPVREGTPSPALPPAAQMPVAEPTFSVAGLREQAESHLPGARIRRREGFRVTLRWQRPL